MEEVIQKFDSLKRVIALPQGIGDGIWCIQKLINTGEQFNFRLPGAPPLRGHQIYELLPQVTASVCYDNNVSYREIMKGNAQERMGGNWADIISTHFFLSANVWLEQGNRLEGWLPDLPISYKLPWNTSESDKAKAYRFTRVLTEEFNFIGIYCSAYQNNKNWSGFDWTMWMDLITRFHREDKSLVFVVIGAKYDLDLSGQIMEEMKRQNIKYVDTIGEPLGVVIEVMKRLTAFIGFPSGLSILNETLEGDRITRMFYPESLSLMINAWAEPSRIESGAYKGLVFGTPKEAFEYFAPGIL